jgi:hypothetical protein
MRKRAKVKTALIKSVRVDDAQITFVLTDDREVSAPTSWSTRLARASEEERAAWRIGGFGTYVEWPSIDEHVGLWTLLGSTEEEVLASAGFDVERNPIHS